MIPVFGTAAVLVAPNAGLLSTGYVPGNPLAAQHLNFYLYHLTKELNNVLTAVGMSQSTADDTQITQAIGRTNSVISTSGAVITAAQFVGNALVQFTNAAGSSNYLIGSGAARPGIELIVEALSGSGVMIVNGTGSAFLGSGAVRLLWDGVQWCKIGGNAFSQVLISGSGLSWFTPWKGSYKCTVVGGGGGGGGAKSVSTNPGGGGGGGGGTAISVIYESQGIGLVYTVGALASGGTSGPSDGTAGNNSQLSDGISVLIASGGAAGKLGSEGIGGSGGTGGSASGGQINISGGGGMSGLATSSGSGGSGGGTFMGGGGPGVGSTGGGGGKAGLVGGQYGGGGGGAAAITISSAAGGNGSAGIIVIEF